ncbi:MAG: hypothetical protein ACRDNY_07880 [Gaiellaceae bacterium]
MIFRGLTLLLVLYRMYRRLPASQQRQVLRLLGRHGPRLVSTLGRRARRA